MDVARGHRGKLQDNKSKRGWKFLSAAAVTYHHSFVSACGVMVGEISCSDCASVHVCVCGLVVLVLVGLQWKADESGERERGVYRDEP